MGQPETDSGETGWQEMGLWYKLREILTMKGEGPIEGSEEQLVEDVWAHRQETEEDEGQLC